MLDASNTLVSLLSAPRMTRYLARYDGDPQLGLRLYAWNVALSSAFWGPICMLEVVVRNALHEQMVLRCGREDWWAEPRLALCTNERTALSAAIDSLMRQGNLSPSAGDVVAATSFGLWVGLTGAGIPRDRALSYETALWQPRLVRAFPHAGDMRRKQIHRLLDDVRRLRNRIAHHEAIYHQALANRRADILTVAGFISDEARDFIESHDRS